MSRAWRYCYESPEDMPDEVMVTSYGDPANPVRYVRVVTCHDCKHFCRDEFGDWCTLHDFEDTRGMADMFCAWGERKDG